MWNLNVLIEANGKIYDFDYGQTPMEPLTKKEYYDTVFYYQGNFLGNSDYVLREFPADFYLENFTPTGASKQDLSIPGSFIEFIKGNINGKEFPLILMKDHQQY